MRTYDETRTEPIGAKQRWAHPAARSVPLPLQRCAAAACHVYDAAACHVYDTPACHVYDTPACHVYDAAGCHVYDAAAVGEKASCFLPAATKLYVRDFAYRAHRLQARVLAVLYCV